MFFLKGKKKVSITGLGGLDRVGGANCYLLETSGSRVMLDCGCALVPLAGGLLTEDVIELDYPHFDRIAKEGIDLVLLSHSHLDHIGALPKLLKEQPNQRIQVMARGLTHRIVQRLFFFNGSRRIPFDAPFEAKRVSPGRTIQHQDIIVLPVEVPHSVPQSLGFYLEISGKKIFYTGDFKVCSPYHRQTGLFKKSLSELAKKEMDVLFLDSSNVYEEGFTPSDQVVWQELKRIFNRTPGRIVFSTFSSHLDRLIAVIQMAGAQKRPVYVAGRNMAAYLSAGGVRGWKWLGYHSRVKPQPNALILTTGCQAEARSGLVNAIFGEASFQLSHRDTVIISADPIPIPEIENRVKKMVEKLTERVRTIYISRETPDDFSHRAQRANIHVSGHGKKEDLLYMVRALRPKLVIPIHGDIERREYLADLICKEGIQTKILQENTPIEI